MLNLRIITMGIQKEVYYNRYLISVKFVDKVER